MTDTTPPPSLADLRLAGTISSLRITESLLDSVRAERDALARDLDALRREVKALRRALGLRA